MPSSRDPSTIVHPGPGKLAAGEVHASSLNFSVGGDATALAAHLVDPADAHDAQAISIPDFYTLTGEAFTSAVGGPYDGENVLDALNALKDLLPVKPDRIGFDNGAVPNSGLPGWAALTSTVVHGGFTSLGGLGIVTKYLSQGSVGTFNLQGTVFPADRGVLAIYHTTNGDFFNAGQTTLLAALWLGASPAPAGIASANFDPASKTVIQPATFTAPSVAGAAGTYTSSGVGLDLINLTARYPYLTTYPGSVYDGYTVNFSNYQLAKYTVPVAVAAGQAGSYLLVHWRESYASTLAAVQPAGLTALTLVAANCYSAVPADGAATYENSKRSNLYLDALPAGPSGLTITASPVGTVTTAQLSGVPFYNSTALAFDVLSTANDFFKNSYLTNSVASASVPAGYESPTAPVEADLTDFGGALLPHQLYDDGTLRIVNDAGGVQYTLAAPPVTTDVVRFQHPTQAGCGVASPYPYGQVRVRYNTPFAAPGVATATSLYLYNTRGTTGSSTTVEAFSDEQYRYPFTFAPIAGAPMLPAAPYASATSLGTLTDELQVHAGNLIYPSVDYTGYLPAGPDYATVAAGDAANHLRRYVRTFNTGIARNTGSITLAGVAIAALLADAAYDGLEATGHLTGGMILQIKVPGSTGWLDLGRDKGVPDLGTQDFKGASTGVAGLTISYDTTAFTTDNGSGQFLLFVRVTFLNNVAGLALALSNLSWAP